MRNKTSDALTPDEMKRLDGDVLKELRRLRRGGETFARAGRVARKLSCNSVQALGAMERVKHRIRAKTIA